MNKLDKLLSNPKCRFKTTGELIEQFGPNYAGLIPGVDIQDVIRVLSLYSGKQLHHACILRNSFRINDIFLYGNCGDPIHIHMLTTRAYPKYDSAMNILKPGMLVTIGYDVVGKSIAPVSSLRNLPGTVTRVLKVNTPGDYMKNNNPFKNTSAINSINKFCVAVELLKPASNYTTNYIQAAFGRNFHKLVGFEVSWHLRKATDVERKFYYSQHGADLVLTGKAES